MPTDDLTIARLGPGDTERARRCCAPFWDMGSAATNLTGFLADPHCVLLAAEVDGEPVGQVVGHVLRRWDPRPPMLLLYSIDVIAGRRRRGIARALVTEFLRIGRGLGCGSAFLVTNESNAPAVRLYEACGGTRPHPDDVLFVWEDGPPP